MNHVHFKQPARRQPVTSQRSGVPLTTFTPGRPSQDIVSADAFVCAMRGAATGVNIVTTVGPAGRFGLTVSAFASVSADPPSVLVSINQKSPACTAICRNQRFCVNVLAADQRRLAAIFAGAPVGGAPYDFALGSWSDATTGSPVLDEAVASFDCTVGKAIDSGSHTIFIGYVHAVCQHDAEPLLYTNRAYRRVCLDA